MASLNRAWSLCVDWNREIALFGATTNEGLVASACNGKAPTAHLVNGLRIKYHRSGHTTTDVLVDFTSVLNRMKLLELAPHCRDDMASLTVGANGAGYRRPIALFDGIEDRTAHYVKNPNDDGHLGCLVPSKSPGRNEDGIFDPGIFVIPGEVSLCFLGEHFVTRKIYLKKGVPRLPRF